MAIEVTAKTNAAELKSFLTSLGGLEVNEQRVESGWWYGRYDREDRLFDNKLPEPVNA
jgi:hypothetical protein